MDMFRIRGGNPIQGVVCIQGNKNEALPTLAASLLTDEPVHLHNVPPIEDVHLMQEILRSIGAELKVKSTTSISESCQIQCTKNVKSQLPVELCRQLRGAVSLAGPLLARNGEVFLPRPGGDRIGRRRLDTHFLVFEALGAQIKNFSDGFEIQCKQLRGADIWLDEASVTATENAITAAALADGQSIIRNAASEPHVQGLCHLLNSMGAKIKGVASNVLVIEGVSRLHGVEFTIAPDYLEAGSFIALAALTRGELYLENLGEAAFDNLSLINATFQRLGIETHFVKGQLQVPASQSLVIKEDVGETIPRIDSAPWPGFPADMTSVALVTATQCKGTVLIHEKLFESRLFFTDRLISMGARIVLCDPHRAIIMGPTKLQATALSSPDIRAGMALLIAALCAQGTSTIQNIMQIDRGFASIDERLRTLGAEIERVE